MHIETFLGCFSTRFSASPTTSNQSSLGRHELSSSQPSSLRTDQGGNTQSYPESGVESIDDLCIVIKNASIHVRQACSHEQTDVDVLVTDTDPGLRLDLKSYHAARGPLKTRQNFSKHTFNFNIFLILCLTLAIS